MKLFITSIDIYKTPGAFSWTLQTFCFIGHIMNVYMDTHYTWHRHTHTHAHRTHLQNELPSLTQVQKNVCIREHIFTTNLLAFLPPVNMPVNYRTILGAVHIYKYIVHSVQRQNLKVLGHIKLINPYSLFSQFAFLP